MAELEERVAVLETQVRGLSDDVSRAKFTADTCMGRVHFLAENLIEVRKLVTDTSKRVEQIDQRVERVEKEHGAMLKQILAKLDER